MKILIAPWGNPKGWQTTTYCFKNEVIKSKSSISLLKKIINPNKTLIFAMDTLAQNGFNWNELEREVDEFLRKFCEQELKITNAQIKIFPGVGYFKEKNSDKECIFNGNAVDFYYLLYKFLVEFFLSNDIYNVSELEIHVDTTHGINFMTILTYRALKEFCEILAFFKKINFFVYNTDPAFPFGAAKKININKIESLKITPIFFNKSIINKKFILFSNISYNEIKNFYKELSINQKNISAFLGSIYNGLPLGIYTFFPDIELLEKLIKKVNEIYYSLIRILSEKESLEINKNAKLIEGYKILIITYFLGKMFEKKFKIAKKQIVSIEELENLNKNFFTTDKRFFNRIKNDLYSISQKLMSKHFKNWHELNIFFAGKADNTIDERNFLAHSGFERNAVKVLKSDNLFLKYDENKIETIMNLAKIGLC